MIPSTKNLSDRSIPEGEVQLSLGELSRACSVHAEYVVQLVEQGILQPIDTENARWVFPGSSLKRVKTVVNLQRDLGVNLPGVALALELMEEVDDLQAELTRPERQTH